MLYRGRVCSLKESGPGNERVGGGGGVEAWKVGEDEERLRR